MRTQNIGMNRDYHNSLKHVSEKLQHASNINFNGRVDGSGIKKRYFGDNEPMRKRYLDEFSEHARQTYAHESDNEGMKNYYAKGMSTLHGSQ